MDQQENGAPKGIRLGGVDYEVIVDGTLEHDNWVRKVALRAGILGMTPAAGESDQQFAERLCEVALQSGDQIRLVAALLLPAGQKTTDWRESTAEEIAGRLAQLTDPDDKRLFFAQLGTILAGFFQSGAASSTASPNSSQTKTGSETAPERDDQGFTAQQVDAMASGVC